MQQAVSATTGARRGELLALRWADADIESRSLAIQRAYTEGPPGPVLAPTETRRSHRVALDRTSILALQKLAANQGVDEQSLHRFVFSHRADGD